MYRCFFIILVFLLSAHVQAWSALGHQVICDIAWQQSDQELRQKLSASAKRMGYNTFATACVWADHIRKNSDYDWLKPMHYMNVSRRDGSVSGCAKKGFFASKTPSCVLDAVDYFTERMKDPKLDEKTRDEALLLVGHFIGDLHQPLHVAYADDRGGNSSYRHFKGKKISLHRFWDGEVLTCGQYVRWKTLSQQVLDQEIKVAVGAPKDWADESLLLTRDIYSTKATLITPKDCERWQSLAQRRLYQAGIRLSHWLSANL